MSELLVVIRSNRERTVDWCRGLAVAQWPEEHVRLLGVAPFLSAVQETFALGVRSGAAWLLALDADVLLFPGAVEYMLRVARCYGHDDLVRIDFTVLDKFRGRTCAGAHLYNNRWSQRLLEFLRTDPEAGQRLRPESDNLEAFCRPRGLVYRTVFPMHAVGLHDHAQYHADLLHKYRTRKARCAVDGDLESVARRLEAGAARHVRDADWAVARHAFASSGREDAAKALRSLNIMEKGPITREERQELEQRLHECSLPGKTCA